ncbi:ImmA/IrrE family metallo-endopeptidase [Devriesea agamarum]|uniref:ImmA/IrrE family metallo-endopeptidase n=1 Tax=Devriesea agamarum TaxID=472569 RepID=UPI00071D2D92|nr:ImmA/IrrE family metallo-endopeptidase [Devriesea agamarum]
MPPIPSIPETIPAKTTDLITYAEAAGIRVFWSPDLPERGRYIPGINVIVLRHGMTEARTVSTLAHELAHAHFGDWCVDEATERRAWRWAARLLISPVEYALAEAIHHAPGAIARELGVTREIVEAFITEQTKAAGGHGRAGEQADRRQKVSGSNARDAELDKNYICTNSRKTSLIGTADTAVGT